MTALLVPFVRRILRIAAVLTFAGILAGPALASEATPLVSPAWLKARLGSPEVVVLDVRSAIDGGGAEAHARGHIPGAVHSDYDKSGWRVTRNGVPFMLPTLPELEKLIGELGIDEDSHVVVMPAGVHSLDFGAAARVYWTLKAAGVAKVSILDGGFAAWTADPANPLERGAATRPAPKIFTATINRDLIAESSDVEQVGRGIKATLIDARPASYYLGKEKAPAAKAYGRIPGAISLDNEKFYDARTNRLKPRAEVAALVAAIPAGPVVTYCNTGHWAATDWFVLSEILGRKDVKLYYGSMVDWTADVSRPLESARTKWDDLKKTLGIGL
jgi:thiosulfate/3-mercaptopyruvate sulfurtransferase